MSSGRITSNFANNCSSDIVNLRQSLKVYSGRHTDAARKRFTNDPALGIGNSAGYTAHFEELAN